MGVLPVSKKCSFVGRLSKKKQPHTTHSAIDPSLPETYSSKTLSSLLTEWSLTFGYRTFCLLFRSPFGYGTKSPVIEWSNGP